MDASELERLANTTFRYPLFTNLGTEMYGAGRVLKRYGRYPAFLPLWVNATHSLNLNSNPPITELNTPFFFTLVYCERFLEAYKQKSSSYARKSMSPFAIHRKANGVEKSLDATGTIFFFQHSTRYSDNVLDYDEFVEHLNTLPKAMMPIDVCLHYIDIQKGVHLELIDRGINCVTVGHSSRPDFVERFYKIVRNYAYAAGSEMSAPLIYCCDLGLPVSTVQAGPNSYILDLDQPNMNLLNYDAKGILLDGAEYLPDGKFRISKKHYNKILFSPRYVEILDAFNGINLKITQNQQKIAEEELGIWNSVSRFQAMLIFYASIVLSPLKLLLQFIRYPNKILAYAKILSKKILRDMKGTQVN